VEDIVKPSCPAEKLITPCTSIFLLQITRLRVEPDQIACTTTLTITPLEQVTQHRIYLVQGSVHLIVDNIFLYGWLPAVHHPTVICIKQVKICQYIPALHTGNFKQTTLHLLQTNVSTRYSALNNDVTLKTGLGVLQDH